MTYVTLRPTLPDLDDLIANKVWLPSPEHMEPFVDHSDFHDRAKFRVHKEKVYPIPIPDYANDQDSQRYSDSAVDHWVQMWDVYLEVINRIPNEVWERSY